MTDVSSSPLPFTGGVGGLAHAQQGISEAKALMLIWGGVDAECARPTADPQTITPGESIN